MAAPRKYPQELQDRAVRQPAPDEVVMLVDRLRDRFGVEPVCRVLDLCRAPTTAANAALPQPAPSAMRC